MIPSKALDVRKDAPGLVDQSAWAFSTLHSRNRNLGLRPNPPGLLVPDPTFSRAKAPREGRLGAEPNKGAISRHKKPVCSLNCGHEANPRVSEVRCCLRCGLIRSVGHEYRGNRILADYLAEFWNYTNDGWPSSIAGVRASPYPAAVPGFYGG